jgi:type IV secretory pathway VirB4 component
MHQLLAPCAFAGEHVVLTKRQDLFTVLRVPGIDPECLDSAQLDYMAQRFAASMRILGPEYRVYQYILKRDSPELPSSPRRHPVAARRAEWLGDRAENLYSIELYWVVLRMRTFQDTSIRSFLSWFSVKRRCRFHERNWSVNRNC